jgi:hypothetical protein
MIIKEGAKVGYLYIKKVFLLLGYFGCVGID